MDEISFRRKPLPHEALNPTGLVALIVNLVGKGYRYYFIGIVKEGKDSRELDRRMLAAYPANLSKSGRERRRANGQANFRYLRHERWYIVLATEGEAPAFWCEDRCRIRHVRETPIRFFGYSVSYKLGGNAKLSPDEKGERNEQWAAYKKARQLGRRAAKPPPTRRDMKWHVHVELDLETYRGLKSYFLNIATHREAVFLAQEFSTLPFEPYAPIRNQYRNILRAVNEARHLAGYQRIPLSVIRFERRVVGAFEPVRLERAA